LSIESSEIKYSDDGDRKDPTFSITSAVFINPSPPNGEQSEQSEAALKTLDLEPMLREIQEQGHSREGLQTMGIKE
jgi:hypothetical protein